MADPVTWETLKALKSQLAVIAVGADYNTDIGTLIRLNDWQRADSQRPSIAIGSRSGELNLAAENGADGRARSPRARRMAIVLEAAMDSDAKDEERIAHLMLEDIERAFARDTRIAPFSVRGVLLDSWSIVDRIEGSTATVLQILGTAEYLRPQP